MGMSFLTVFWISKDFLRKSEDNWSTFQPCATSTLFSGSHVPDGRLENGFGNFCHSPMSWYAPVGRVRGGSAADWWRASLIGTATPNGKQSRSLHVKPCAQQTRTNIQQLEETKDSIHGRNSNTLPYYMAALWAGKMNQILRCDWLPKRARWSYLAHSGLPAKSRKKNFPESLILINPLLTKFVRSRWLHISLILFWGVYRLRLRLGPYKTRKKRTWPISSHLELTLGQ